MQNSVVKAFRQRLVRAGYTYISIFDNCCGKYRVRCVSPDGIFIQVLLTEIEMDNLPRVVWFDDYLK